jgi:hypothetical protein
MSNLTLQYHVFLTSKWLISLGCFNHCLLLLPSSGPLLITANDPYSCGIFFRLRQWTMSKISVTAMTRIPVYKHTIINRVIWHRPITAISKSHLKFHRRLYLFTLIISAALCIVDTRLVLWHTMEKFYLILAINDWMRVKHDAMIDVINERMNTKHWWSNRQGNTEVLGDGVCMYLSQCRFSTTRYGSNQLVRDMVWNPRESSAVAL